MVGGWIERFQAEGTAYTELGSGKEPDILGTEVQCGAGQGWRTEMGLGSLGHTITLPHVGVQTLANVPRATGDVEGTGEGSMQHSGQHLGAEVGRFKGGLGGKRRS